MEDRLGIYLHIPFCVSKCDYCDFYSLPGQEGHMDAYQKALLAHMREAAPMAQGIQVDTIYVGGGTPSYYGAKRLKELLAAVHKLFSVEKGCEITVECNPDGVNLKFFQILRRAGVNRISLGMQSAQQEELAQIHRIHTAQQVEQAMEQARRAKLSNLSLDLIYGLPGQTMESWQKTVRYAIALQPTHLSCYGLTVEEGTPLAQRVARGEVLPSQDLQAEEYLWMVDCLQEAGYDQYEISNFARPGFASQHNLRYWLTRPYMGFGPGAHSDFGGRRYSYSKDLQGYIQGVLHGGNLVEDSELIPKRERSSEYLMLRLRTLYGVEEQEYRNTYFMDFAPLAARLRELEEMGLAARQNGRWHFTPKGFLVSNQLILDLLERQEQAQWRDLVSDHGQTTKMEEIG